MSRVRDLASILTASSSIATDTEVSAVSAQIPANVAGKNYLINGGFDFWQRGTSYSMTASWAYGAPDRWGIQQYPTGGACTLSRSTDVPGGAIYSLKMQRTASSTNTSSMGIMQCVESSNAILLQGKTVTLSFWAKAGANFSGGSLNAKIQTGTVADQELGLANGSYTGNIVAANTSPLITTTWTRYSVSVTLASNIKEISVNINWAGTGTAGADDSVYISNVQLEQSSVVTDFSRAGGNLVGELVACQRYYCKSYNLEIAPGTSSAFGVVMGLASNSSYIATSLRFPVEMRVRPSMSLYSQIGTLNKVSASGAIDSANTGAFDTNVVGSGAAGGVSVSGLTTSQFYYYHYVASAEL